MSKLPGTGLAHVVAVGPLPPPMQGAAATTQAFVDHLRRLGPVSICNNATGAHGIRPLRALVKLGRWLGALGSVLGHARRPDRALYIALDGGLGLAYNLAVVALGRLLRYRLYLHHHSFAYINRRSALFALLAVTAGRNASHIVLCGLMGQRLAGLYPSAARYMVLTSAALVDTAPLPKAPAERDVFTLGFLSNLMLEKGVDTAIDILRTGQRHGIPLRLELAGRATDTAAADLVGRARTELGEALDAPGAIPEEAKSGFFGRLDLFVFPTRYRNEAEPRAVIEALFHGVPVLIPDRGCLADLVGPGACGLVVRDGDDFTATALNLIEGWIADPARQRAAREAALARGHDLHQQGRVQLESLTRRIYGKI